MESPLKDYFPSEILLEKYVLQKNDKYILNPEAAALFRENLPYYLLEKGESRQKIYRNLKKAQKLEIGLANFKKILSGERRHNALGLYFAENVAKEIDVPLEQLISPLLLDMDYRIKKFIHAEKNRGYIFAMMEYIETDDKSAFRKNISRISLNFKEPDPYTDNVFPVNIKCYSRKKGIGLVDIAKKLGIHTDTVRKNIKKGRLRRKIAEKLNVKVGDLLTPQLFYVDPDFKRLIKKLVDDEKNIKYIYALMDYVKDDYKTPKLENRIGEIKKENIAEVVE